ncbi:hypothetical protein E2C01_037070 [Portunus trituberculatus]|uniref:Uncharacterized protein n=1 Tax=Portunus trituberculatus TaxID=210409 RepID=A0A5B7FEB9_PORTR|nr:hypothetical protein [Portunus trituberculatus]
MSRLFPHIAPPVLFCFVTYPHVLHQPGGAARRAEHGPSLYLPCFCLFEFPADCGTCQDFYVDLGLCTDTCTGYLGVGCWAGLLSTLPPMIQRGSDACYSSALPFTRQCSDRREKLGVMYLPERTRFEFEVAGRFSLTWSAGVMEGCLMPPMKSGRLGGPRHYEAGVGV